MVLPNDGTIGNQADPGNQGAVVPDFKRILKTFKTSGGARRGKPKLAVKKSGASRTNIEGKGLTQTFMQGLGADPHNFEVYYGASVALGQVAIYLAKPNDPAAMRPTIYASSISLHLGAIFEEYPQLRPSTTVDCTLTTGADQNGVPCLLVNIAGGSPSRTVKRPPAEKPETEKK